MYSYPTRNEIAITESLTIKNESYFGGWFLDHYDTIPTYDFERNLIDDTFNIVARTSSTDIAEQLIYFDSTTDIEAINNAYFTQAASLRSTMPYHVNEKIGIHSSVLENKKFSDTDFIVFSMQHYISGIGSLTRPELSIIRNTVNQSFFTSNKSITGTFDDAFRVTTPEQVSYSLGTELKNLGSVAQHDIMPEPIIYNNNTYFLPRPMDVDNHTSTIMDVFMENESGNDVEFDHSLNMGKLKTSSLGTSELDVRFVRTPEDTEEEYIKNGSGMKGVKKVGELVIDDHTYYDFDSGKTKIGLTNDSQVGELIPYNYSGVYTRELEFYINDSIGEVNLQWSENIASPLLDEFDGLYKLEINNDYPSTITNLKHLPADSVTELRDRLKDDEEAYATLPWFERATSA